MKKLVNVLLAAVMLLSMAACGSSNSPGGASESKYTELPTIDQIKVGEDYQDITATVKVLTNRNDIAGTTYAEYAKTFHQLYPNITVEYEGITDYEEALNLRLPNGDWGDICFIPSTVSKKDMSNYFSPLGSVDTLNPVYNFIADKAYTATTRSPIWPTPSPTRATAPAPTTCTSACMRRWPGAWWRRTP